MGTNTVVLIVVAVAVALILIGVVAIMRYKLRAERRLLGVTGILDEAEQDARLVQQAERVDSEIKAFRTRGKRTPSADARQTADMRAQLNDLD